MSDQLPSIDNLPESELPSVDEFIKDEQELPSVNDFIENPDESDEIEAAKLEEGKKCGEGEYFCNDEQKCKPIPKGHKVLEDGELVKEEADLTEILRLINNVRKDIPDIPEIKYYDEELEKLTEQVELVRDSIPEIPEPPEIPEIKYYDDEIASLREEVKDLPVPKYYEEEIEGLQKKVDGFYQDMMELPEPKYYEKDLESLKEDINAVRDAIPTFPKWVNEVNQVPDFSWIGKTFGVIDDDFTKVNDHINDLKDKFDDNLLHLTEDLDKKDFEKKVELKKVNSDLKETKDKIYKELREAALSIHDAKHGYKNDDRLLKKNILGKLNVLKQRVEEEIKEFNRKNTETKDLYGGYFEGLTQEIANLPEVKYYDEDIERLSGDVKNLKSLYLIVEELKEKQKAFKNEFNEVKNLQEGLLNEPNDKSQSVDGTGDPLTPLDKQFPNLKALADHYRLFISRTQQQIATIGGGGAGFIKDLADVTFTESTGTNKLLIYNGDGWVGIASTALSGSSDSTLDDVLKNGNVTGVGMSVGVITATNGYFSGIVTATTLNYDVVSDIYSTGIVTATKGIQQTGAEGLHVTAGVSTFVGLTSCLAGLHVRAGSANTALIVEGHGRITGILTIGTGSITLDAANNKVKVGTGITLNAAAGTIEVYNTTTEKVSTVVNPSGEANYTGIVTATGGLHVGTAATIYANGNISCGILTATNFIGDGSGLTGVANTDNVVSTTLSVSGVVTAIGGLYVGTAASIYSNGNISAAGIVTANGGFVGGLTGNVTGNATGLSGTPNITIGDLVGASLDISGNADIDGTLEADAITVDGTALNEYIADTIGAMVSSNTESGITVAYQDADNTLDFTVGTLNQDTTGTADNITITANNSTDETVYPIFVDGATGSQGAESDTGLTYNPSDGNLTATTFTGALTGNVTGNASGSSGSCTGNAAGLTGTPNITVGDVVAASLDISGNTDIDGTLEADAITVDGTALNEYIADTVGAMVSSNTESGITVAYVDDDNTLDFTVGTLNQDTTGTAALAEGLTGTPDITVDEITTRNINVTGISTFADHVNIGADSKKLKLGAGGDLQIYYTGSAGWIYQSDSGNAVTLGANGGAVYLRTGSSANDDALKCVSDGAVEIYHNGTKKAETAAGGFTVTGTCTATTFSGSGASLTNIPGVASESDTSVSSTSATTVATLSASTYRAAIIDVLITQGSAYQAGQYGLIHDGTTATIVEQWAIATGDMLGTFTTTISGGNMLLQVNMGSSSSATVTVKSSTLTV